MEFHVRMLRKLQLNNDRKLITKVLDFSTDDKNMRENGNSERLNKHESNGRLVMEPTCVSSSIIRC